MTKRVFDITIVLLTLPIWLPLLCVLLIAATISVKDTPIFKQHRGGYQGRVITLYKIKSMLNTRDDQGDLLPDSERLTRFGKLIRATSLDEIPSLINVLKGDLSLVGPRPLIAEYLTLYSEQQARRHDIKPGITGWAQVNGRNTLSWEEKFELDVWYVENQSFWLDMKILFMTVVKVFKREGIAHEGDVAMPKFKGSKK